MTIYYNDNWAINDWCILSKEARGYMDEVEKARVFDFKIRHSEAYKLAKVYAGVMNRISPMPKFEFKDLRTVDADRVRDREILDALEYSLMRDATNHRPPKVCYSAFPDFDPEKMTVTSKTVIVGDTAYIVPAPVAEAIEGLRGKVALLTGEVAGLKRNH
jgi:hypothetical protein